MDNEQHRGSTKKNYRSIWKNFNSFIVKLDVKPQTWEDRVSLYVGYLISTNKQSSTVRSYVSAIKTVLQANRIKINENKYMLSSLTRACRLVNDKVRTREPLHKSLLQALLKQVKVTYDQQQYLKILYSALFSTAYFGLFRIGELTQSDHVVKAVDVQIGTNKKKILFILRSSKTHGKNNYPQKVKISSTDSGKDIVRSKSGTKYCLYKLLRNYMAIRPILQNKHEQFFVFRDRSPVTPVNARKCLKELLWIAGYDHTVFFGHSFRTGRALDLLKYGLSVETIKDIGHWKSNAVFLYLRS